MLGRLGPSSSERDIRLLISFQHTCRHLAHDLGLLDTILAKVQLFITSVGQ